jgi:uncharacterized caspase-like protein
MPRAITKTTTETLWCISIGVSQYQDKTLNPLPYSMTDCQGFAKAIEKATAKKFPKQEIIIYHENALKPNLSEIRASLDKIVANANSQDTIIFYFAGHGVPDNHSSQALLCLADTQRTNILNTGLAMQELLEKLASAKASQQLIILDACHSGSLTLRQSLTPNLLKQLQQASSKQSFYALLSCDQDQESYEFPQLEHGLFTYYLIRGLQGEAVDNNGEIEVNSLYKYVYHQTLQYIDKLNLRRRLVNKRKRSYGETDSLYQEQKLQTPKLIVEAVGELVLAKQLITDTQNKPLRQALIIDGYQDSKNTQLISKTLINAGNFDLKYWHSQVRDLPNVRDAINDCLSLQQPRDKLSTALLYLRGTIEENTLGESLFVINDDIKLSRTWLRQQLRSSEIAQQIIILDVVGVETLHVMSLQNWITDLQPEGTANQCLIAGASSIENQEEFTQALLKTLSNANSQTGLSVAQLITGMQEELAASNIWRDFFLAGIQGVIEVLPPSSAQKLQAVDLGICPYLGLRAFTDSDAQYFYGRETLTQQLINEINQNSFLAVVGASGSGKSSVVQAGLIANLKLGKQLPTSSEWWIKCFRPGENPMLALAQVMLDKDNKTDTKRQLLEYEGLLHLGCEGFVYWLRQRPEPTLLLVIDQFEELFTLAPDSTQQFLQILLEALEYAPDKFKLIITLRADFIAPCLEIPALAKHLQTASVLVPPSLSENDYHQVIEKPAQQVGLNVEPGLVELLLQDLQDSSGDLPLLQFVLEQLWEYRSRDASLTIQAYREKIGGIKGALERKAQAVYDDLTDQEKDIAQWIFLTLTQLGEGTEDTRRKVTKTSLFESQYPQILVEATLQKFIEAKLIVVSQDEIIIPQSRAVKSSDPDIESQLELLKAEVTVEVTHEILIRHWSTLRWWLTENRERLYQQQRLEKKAREWEQKGKSPDFLLQKIQLTEAEAFVQKYSAYLRPLEQQYIQQSIKARLFQRLRIGGFIGSAAAVILGFGLFAWQQQQQSQLAQLVRYASFKTITKDIANQISSSLPKLLETANTNQRKGELSKALDDYRQIIFISNNLQIITNKNKINNLNNLTKSAETSLSKIIAKTQLTQLELELKAGNFGKLQTPDFALFENQYTGALKLTYAILLREQGAKADINNDGYLTEGEQALLPCQTLKDLEQLWRKYTQNRCSWRLFSDARLQPDCKELGGFTLTLTIFGGPNVYLAEKRFNQCQL